MEMLPLHKDEQRELAHIGMSAKPDGLSGRVLAKRSPNDRDYSPMPSGRARCLVPAQPSRLARCRHASRSMAAPAACIGSAPLANRSTTSLVKSTPGAPAAPWLAMTRPSAFAAARPSKVASKRSPSNTATVRMSTARVSGSTPTPRQDTRSFPPCAGSSTAASRPGENHSTPKGDPAHKYVVQAMGGVPASASQQASKLHCPTHLQTTPSGVVVQTQLTPPSPV